MRLHARLRRLEQQRAVDRGCPACRDRRGLAVWIEARRLADGTVLPEAPEPAACAVCGQVPEQIIEVIVAEVPPPQGASG